MIDSDEIGINYASCTVTVGSSGIIENAVYYIQNANSGKYIDVEGPSSSNGAYIQIWQFHGDNQSKWYFQLCSDGYYRIKSIYSLKYLRVTSSSYIQGDTITQNSVIVSGSKWAIMKTNANNFAFVPASSTTSLNCSIEQTTTVYWTQQLIYWLSLGNSISSAISLANNDMVDHFRNTIYASQTYLIINGLYYGSSNINNTIFD